MPITGAEVLSAPERKWPVKVDPQHNTYDFLPYDNGQEGKNSSSSPALGAIMHDGDFVRNILTEDHLGLNRCW